MVFFKILLGYLLGIRSERQLMREIEVNLAYRWYIGYSLTQKVPNASTLSQTRRRRFKDNTVYQDIFKEIVFLAIHHQMVGGQVICTDSTHLKANANKNKCINQVVQESSVNYLNDLEQAVTLERAKHGQKPLKPQSEQTRNDDDPPSAGGTGKTRNIKTQYHRS